MLIWIDGLSQDVKKEVTVNNSGVKEVVCKEATISVQFRMRGSYETLDDAYLDSFIRKLKQLQSQG